MMNLHTDFNNDALDDFKTILNNFVRSYNESAFSYDCPICGEVAGRSNDHLKRFNDDQHSIVLILES